jgi:S-adenosylmethionine:tRNA-ribosyltransferase-isomerase (queuine synthetase)
VHISDFDYQLPEELIAQRPLECRDASRMLVVDRARTTWRDSHFSELPAEIRASILRHDATQQKKRAPRPHRRTLRSYVVSACSKLS